MQVRTPLLILHGKKDTRVSPGQSVEPFRYLQAPGNVPVRWSGIPTRAAATARPPRDIDYSMRPVRWMEHDPKGGSRDPPAYPLDYARVVGGD